MKLALALMFFGIWSPTISRADLQSLGSIAASSLLANTHELQSGVYLSAGQHQFKSLWTRDFCYSARALLLLDRGDVVKTQLEALIQNRRKSDGLIPRVLDSELSSYRVFLSLLHIYPGLNDPLKAEYLDQYGSEAIDSNALVLLAALAYRNSLDNDQGIAWWNAHLDGLVQIFHFYDGRRRADGLLEQENFSDWQDSVQRRGATFYANVLYFEVLSLLQSDPAFQIDSSDTAVLKNVIQSTFWDSSSGMYRSLEQGPYVSMDGNLFALDWGFSDEPQTLYQALKQSELWIGKPGFPGRATIPSYPATWKSPFVEFVGLAGYHDTLFWSWLMAYSAKIANAMGDRAESLRILDQLSDVANRDGVVGEVYEPTPGLPEFRSDLYHSEQPFSWGSAFVVDAISSIIP